MNAVTEKLERIESMLRSIRVDEESGRHIATFRGVTEGVARDGMIVRVAGMDLTRFRKNPVIQYGHNRMVDDVSVVGRAVDIRVIPEEGAIDFDVEFPEEGVHELADKVRRLVQAGFIRAVSIGFAIQEFAEITDEQRQELGLPRYGQVVIRSELDELSIVPVGSDQDALKIQRALNSGDIQAEDAMLIMRRDGSSHLDISGLVDVVEQMTKACESATTATASLETEIRSLRRDLREAEARALDEEAQPSERTPSGEQPNDGRAEDDVEPETLEEAMALIRGLREQVSESGEDE